MLYIPAEKTITVTRAGRSYTRIIREREVTFTCVVCDFTLSEFRYPGPLPHYCCLSCQRVAERIDNEQAADRMDRLRAARRKAALARLRCSENV